MTKELILGDEGGPYIQGQVLWVQLCAPQMNMLKS